MEKLLQDVSFGVNLKHLRKSKGFSQTALVAQMQVLGSNISRTTYNKIEQGSRNIYISDLLRLQHIYDISFDEFFCNLEF
jgi:Predicted transcriptional regulators